MSLNDIVVYVDSAEATKSRVEFAVALAKDHGAHLVGVAFAPTALLPLYGADVGFADMSEVLQGVKAVVGQLRGVGMAVNAEDAAVMFRIVIHQPEPVSVSA